MHYALNPRTFLYSHYFYTGLRVGVGVIGLTLIVLRFTELQYAMAASIGALCVSLLEMPAPLKHKFHDMLGALLLCSSITLIVSLCAPYEWLVRVVVIAISFLASMLVVYGRKTMPLQFAALFAMTLAMENDAGLRASLLHFAMFMLGGSCYLAYSLVIAWILRHRIQQQVLAESFFELAKYVELKASCYDPRVNLNEQLIQIVRQQSTLVERQQVARDLLLRSRLREGDTLLVKIHFEMMDLYELILSTHTDYEALRRHFVDTDTLAQLEQLIRRGAREIEAVAYALTRNMASEISPDFGEEFFALDARIAQLATDSNDTPAKQEAFASLRASSNKIKAVLTAIHQLQLDTHLPSDRNVSVPAGDVAPFLSRVEYSRREFMANFRWRSPAFRFAIRVALAVSFGILVSEHLPYAAHGYWIVLTIVIILKPTFSATRQRTVDRIVGTLIGCALTALILHLFHSPAAILAFQFLATVAVPTFVYVRYRYTAIAASMQILLQISLVLHLQPNTITERMIDTLIGAAIATAFSFVLPSWERQNIPGLIATVLRSNRRYIEAARDLLAYQGPDDFPYRLARKRFLDSLAALCAAMIRMPDEPQSEQRALGDISQFVVQNYLVVAHVAALRFLLRFHTKDTPLEAVRAQIDRICRELDGYIDAAEKGFAQQCSLELAAMTAAEQSNLTESSSSKDLETSFKNWSGWAPLSRRIDSLRADAQRISIHSLAISHALTHQP